jgi:hypothetical protein
MFVTVPESAARVSQKGTVVPARSGVGRERRGGDGELFFRGRIVAHGDAVLAAQPATEVDGAAAR